jgi:hypothetical protein
MPSARHRFEASRENLAFFDGFIPENGLMSSFVAFK